jgi:general secretion pathway protein A
MYNKFFGFKEKPFKLVPNPEYLFLSKSHEEALANLTYAISHGEGFVEITGEVGTGKTTLCRVFLGSLDASIEAAYIFNPKLDALQLLKVINDEFGIDSTPDNTKDLIDILNGFLIEKKAAGQKVLVLIDEAQNLSLEVLEQLRLLSNLETTQEKLLQIILVGQPELGDMLSSHQLRQLGQRITINCQLDPLTFQEAKDYIRHRISLASHRAGPPFDNKSYRAIYEYSRGVPRLIYIACDRILLNAFGRNSFNITGAITREAIKELRHKTKKIPARPLRTRTLIASTATAVCLIAALLYLYTDSLSISPAGKTNPHAVTSQAQVDAGQSVDPANPVIDSAPGSSAEPQESTIEETVPDEQPISTEIPGNEQVGELPGEPAPISYIMEPSSANDTQELDGAAESFLHFLKNLNARHSRNSAMLETLRLWSPAANINNQVSMIDTDQAFFRKAAGENGLLIQPIVTDSGINLIQNLNMPAILTFYLPNHAWPQYLTVAGIDDENVYLAMSDQDNLTPVDKKILLRFWSGEAYIVWKNFSNLNGTITEVSKPSSVGPLKKLLHALGYSNITINADFDSETKQLIKEIQSKNGLNADGKVGPLTKIALYNENSAFAKPSLRQIVTANMEPAE